MRSASKDRSSLSEEEHKILLLYIDEFNEIFCDILQLPSGKFLSHLFKRAKITLSHKFNVRSPQTISKIEKYIIEKYYPVQYNLAYNSMKQIKSKFESMSPLMQVSLVYNGNNFIKHCKETNAAVHTCGSQFLCNKSYIKGTENLMFFCI